MTNIKDGYYLINGYLVLVEDGKLYYAANDEDPKYPSDINYPVSIVELTPKTNKNE